MRDATRILIARHVTTAGPYSKKSFLTGGSPLALLILCTLGGALTGFAAAWLWERTKITVLTGQVNMLTIDCNRHVRDLERKDHLIEENALQRARDAEGAARVPGLEAELAGCRGENMALKEHTARLESERDMAASFGMLSERVLNENGEMLARLERTIATLVANIEKKDGAM
jgi:hypothetical protein